MVAEAILPIPAEAHVPGETEVAKPSGECPSDPGLQPSSAAEASAHLKDVAATVGVIASFGAFVLLLFLCHYQKETVTEADERWLYLLPGTFAPPLALFAAWLFLRARRTIFRDSQAFPLVMAAANALFWAVGLFLYRRASLGLNEADLIHAGHVLAWAFCATNAGAFLACLPFRWVRLSVLQRQILHQFIDDAYGLLPLAAAFAIAMFSNYAVTRWSSYVVPAACALLALGLATTWNAGQARARWFIDAAVVCLVVCVVFNPNYPFDELHYSFFLGPVASLLAGKRILVDVNCQYGVGVIYFLAAIFKLGMTSMSYQGMSAFLNVLGILHFLTLYALLRLCLRSQRHCVWVLVMMLIIRVLSGATVYTRYPSLGPLRFMMGDVLLLLVALRARLPRFRTFFGLCALLTVGVSSVWSAETFSATFVAFLAIVLYAALFGDGPPVKRLLEAAKALGGALASIALAHALLAADIHLHTHRWPDWSQYGAYLTLYARVDFWAMPITPWEPWAPIALVYFVSIGALLAKPLLFGRRDLGVEEIVAFGMSVLGIVEFSHYVGRSHIEHLRIYFADIYLAGYWTDRVARRPVYLSRAFRTSLVACVYAASGLLVLAALPNATAKLGDTLLGRFGSDQPFVLPSWVDQDAPGRPALRDHMRQDAIDLITKYAPDKRRVAVFMDRYLRPIVFMQTGKAHLWPLSATEQDEIEPEAKARVLSFHDDLKIGDVIFVGDNLTGLDTQLVTMLAARFRFKELERLSSGLRAVRLDAPGSAK